ncbi:hypothetical protein [Luteimonas sp. SDU101]|uniref:hypothetical protein n=1 Tax=Luteimonas sp. SDU101 TaxID=3422593 RepID=UPI003EBE0706
MNAALRTLLVLLALVGITACASTPDAAHRVADPPRPGSVVVDDAYVARVEQLASRRSLDVHWVNPPLRRTAPRR